MHTYLGAGGTHEDGGGGGGGGGGSGTNKSQMDRKIVSHPAPAKDPGSSDLNSNSSND